MLHEPEDLTREKERLDIRPRPDANTPVLAFLDVTVPTDQQGYVRRVREVLSPVLELALSQPFQGEEIPVHSIPDSVVRICEWRPTRAPAFVLAG
ncbi:hypothetical protein [Streptomyces specialis]|uniref:hypothetical protein n=1 Tax=Streptomyces specialis TaxID=498367 RepID=UPI00073F6167|nr:hypothetical protein [Streptomyces specialis]